MELRILHIPYSYLSLKMPNIKMMIRCSCHITDYFSLQLHLCLSSGNFSSESAILGFGKSLLNHPFFSNKREEKIESLMWTGKLNWFQVYDKDLPAYLRQILLLSNYKEMRRLCFRNSHEISHMKLIVLKLMQLGC